jgi:hypothetical protein
MSKPGKAYHHSRSHQGKRAAIGLGDDLGGIDTPCVIIRIDQQALVRRCAAGLPGLPALREEAQPVRQIRHHLPA